MKKRKKLTILFLIIALLISTFYPFSNTLATEVVNEEAILNTFKDEKMRERIKTVGLTQEQCDFIAGYVRTYLAEAHKMNPRPFIYDDKNRRLL